MMPYEIKVCVDVRLCEYFEKIGHNFSDCWKKQRDEWSDQLCSFCGKQGHADIYCLVNERMEQQMARGHRGKPGADGQNLPMLKE